MVVFFLFFCLEIRDGETSKAFVISQQNWILCMQHFFQKDNRDHVTVRATVG